MRVDKIEVHMHVSGKVSDADINDMIERVNKGLAKKMRGNANLQVATSGSVRS